MAIARSIAPAVTTALLWMSTARGANTWLVSPNGSDASPGSGGKPFKTVQKAIRNAADGDTIRIKPGTHNLADFIDTIDRSLTLIGEDRETTILTKGRLVTITKSLTLKQLTFSGGPGFRLSPPKGKTLDGMLVENCVFENFWCAFYARYYDGAIANFTVRNCEFRNMEGGKVNVIALCGSNKDEAGRSVGPSHVEIVDNTFTNLKSTQKGCTAISVGDMKTTKDVLVSGNVIDTVGGPTWIRNGAGPEVHGVLIFGTNVRITKNTVRNLNPGRDHEAVYMKARHSVIADNVVENCGSGFGGADITSKGGEFSENNTISGNRITGPQPGCGIFASGGTAIKDNYVKKPNGLLGINVYPLSRPVTITGNYVETKHRTAIYVNGGDHAGYPFKWPNPGEIFVTGNTAIAYEGTVETAVKMSNAPWAKVSGNTRRAGKPEPTSE